MSPADVTHVDLLRDHWLRRTFSDGAVIDIDAGPLIQRGGVFESIHSDRRVYEAVRVNPETGTIEWPGEVDICPDVLYGRGEPASGVRFERRVVRAAPGAAG
jgi:hypothetical protein